VSDIDRVWACIEGNAGQEFRLKQGKSLTYRVYGGAVVPSTVNRNLPRGDFAKALERQPLTGHGALQDLQGPSYIWAILTDARIR
jgi:hypothetical protein